MSTTIVKKYSLSAGESTGFNLFHYHVKLYLLRMKCVSKHQNLQMFGQLGEHLKYLTWRFKGLLTL